ncbi:unnamed protein product [Arctia plantaginis]|uniref:Uncharacterized protein n=1 Tax=Arctia plantaginis TaxID=874455 RepID=A0A8S1AZS1_ARCPL|nr:unnamed protein product [Arctia plantaginis]
MQRQHNILDEARAREAARASRAEAEAERARSEAAAAGAAGGSVNEGWQTVNYARALKRAPKAPPLNIPPHPLQLWQYTRLKAANSNLRRKRNWR